MPDMKKTGSHREVCFVVLRKHHHVQTINAQRRLQRRKVESWGMLGREMGACWEQAVRFTADGGVLHVGEGRV